MAKIELYIDGSYSPTLETYGSGIVVLQDGELTHKLSVKGTEPAFNKYHNVAGEEFASILGLMWVQKNLQDHSDVTVYYDYAGLAKWPFGEWSANNTMSQFYRDFIRKLPFKVKFAKVRAHSGVTYNELADKLARGAVGLS